MRLTLFAGGALGGGLVRQVREVPVRDGDIAVRRRVDELRLVAQDGLVVEVADYGAEAGESR